MGSEEIDQKSDRSCKSVAHRKNSVCSIAQAIESSPIAVQNIINKIKGGRKKQKL